MLASALAVSLILVITAVVLFRDSSSVATQPRSVTGATCAPAAFGPGGLCVTLFSDPARGQAVGYNLTIPAGWRETQMPPGTEPVLRDRSNVSPALTAAFLLDRHVFTARPPEQWLITTTNVAPAWDLDVQLWNRQGRTAVEWSRTFGSCDPSVPVFGPSACVQSTETIRGMTFQVTKVRSVDGSKATSYYLERGDELVILRYWFDQQSAAPGSVTETTLEDIVHSFGQG